MRYLEKIAVAKKVTRDTTQTQPVAAAPAAEAVGAASLRALPARVRPIIMATEPVIVGGSTFSTAFFPENLTKRPAAIEIRPDIIIPN